MNNSWK